MLSASVPRRRRLAIFTPSVAPARNESGVMASCEFIDYRPARSIDVTCVAPFGGQLSQPGIRILGALAAVLDRDVAQRGVDVLGHVRGIAADIDVRAFL